MTISNLNFHSLIRGDRVLTPEGMATVLYQTEDEPYVLDLDSCGSNGYRFTLDRTFQSAFSFVGVPLSMVRVGEEFTLQKDYSNAHTGEDVIRIIEQESQKVTIQEVNIVGFSYEYDNGETVLFKWDSESEQSVEERLAKLLDMNKKVIEGVIHPIHGHADAHPSMETLSAGHRFNDGVHSRPKFYSVLFVSEEGIRVENVDTKEQAILAPSDLVNYFQSVQPSQMIPGAVVYRKPGWFDPSAVVYQKIESVSGGRIEYTEDSTITHADSLSNMMCPLEQRKMYFYV